MPEIIFFFKFVTGQEEKSVSLHHIKDNAQLHFVLPAIVFLG